MSTLPPRFAVFDDTFRHVCRIDVEAVGTTGTGMSKPSVETQASNVPCNLQEMTTSRQMAYKAEADNTLFDLYLPGYIGGVTLPINAGIGWRFVIEGVTYRAIGKALRMGESGKVRIPVEGMNQP